MHTHMPAWWRKVGRMPDLMRWLSGPSHRSPYCCAHQLYIASTLHARARVCVFTCAGALVWRYKQNLACCEGFWPNMSVGDAERQCRLEAALSLICSELFICCLCSVSNCLSADPPAFFPLWNRLRRITHSHMAGHAHNRAHSQGD